MKQLGYADGYKYAHGLPPGHFVRQQFLPDGLEGDSIWEPQPNPRRGETARAHGKPLDRPL